MKKNKTDKLNIEIVQLPDAINPNKMIEQEIYKRYVEKCPVCKRKRENLMLTWTDHDYIKYETHPIKRIFAKSYYSERKYCKCDKCGTVWYTPWYPKDVVDKDVLLKFSEKLFDSENSEKEST